MRDLGLSGNFRVKFEFDEDELRNWLEKYIEECPAKALRLLAEMQADAVIARAGSAKAPESDDTPNN